MEVVEYTSNRATESQLPNHDKQREIRGRVVLAATAKLFDPVVGAPSTHVCGRPRTHVA